MELVPGKLYFALSLTWKDKSAAFPSSVVNVDENSKHSIVRKHFGPPSLKTIWKQCDWVDEKVRRCAVTLVTNSKNDNLSIEQRTLSAFFVSAYAVLRLNWEAEHANKLLLTSIPARLAYFRDFHGDSTYKLTIADCLKALELGCKHQGWFTSLDALRFPQATASQLDMDWIVPGKLLALKDPTTNRDQDRRGVSKPVIKELNRLTIKTVVRLNSYDHIANYEYYGCSYQASDFAKEGFQVHDIPFKDVGIPTDKQVRSFLHLVEKSDRALAVHCHAGLGRTATMIGCYLIKAYGFDARSTCAWIKMCRRGSVMGPQHFFLDKYEAQWKNIVKGRKQMTATSQKVSTMQDADLRDAKSKGTKPLPTHRQRTQLARAPRKNNIIHIEPVKPTIHFRTNDMTKYQSPANPDAKVASASPKRKLVTSSEKGASVSTRESSPNQISRKTKPSTLRSSALGTNHRTNVSSSEQPQVKRLRRESPGKFAVVRPTLIHLQVDNPRSQNTSRESHYSLRHRETKSHHDAITIKHRGAEKAAPLPGSSSWTHGVSGKKVGKQWGSKGIGSLVLRSKSRLLSLISNIYARDASHSM